MNTLAYTERGKGQCLVLIHGFCEDKSLWTEFADKLSASYRIICPDLNGFGQSSALEGEFSIEKFAESVKNLLDNLKISQCVMIGHSLGGYVALAFAEKYPSILKGLGLFHSTSFADDDTKKETRNKTIDFVKENGAEKFLETAFPNLFGQTFKNAHPEKVNAYLKYVSSTPTESVWKTTAAMRDRKDRSALLNVLNVPVLFIVGKEDNAVSLQNSLAQIHLPKESHILILDKVGHNGMIEAPDKTLKAVKQFLEICYE
ncbi:MAG: alpha/beta hydrolase [Flammeovirgaceae bacterium]